MPPATCRSRPTRSPQTRRRRSRMLTVENVDTTADTVTFTSHGLIDGDTVIYDGNNGNIRT